MIQFKDYLLDVNGNKACEDAREWTGNRTLAQCWTECERGDWMMWLLSHSKLSDLRTLTKIKALQVEKIRHLLKDPRSISALDAAHAFGRGEISEQKLSADAYAPAAARLQFLKGCADIVRSVIPNIEIENVL